MTGLRLRRLHGKRQIRRQRLSFDVIDAAEFEVASSLA